MVNMMYFWSLDSAMLYLVKWYGLLYFATKLSVVEGLALNIFLQKIYTIRIELTVVLQSSDLWSSCWNEFWWKTSD